MTQIATVRRVLGNGRVEIAVRRQSACGHDCENCAGCGAEGGVIRTVAYDTIGVTEGDKVLVFSESKGVLGAAAMVYLLPLVFFFFGYAPVIRSVYKNNAKITESRLMRNSACSAALSMVLTKSR